MINISTEFYFNRVFKVTGPFVVMIYKMVIGDIAEFSTIYSGFLFGFTLGSRIMMIFIDIVKFDIKKLDRKILKIKSDYY